jgi:hypothetical protein
LKLIYPSPKLYNWLQVISYTKYAAFGWETMNPYACNGHTFPRNYALTFWSKTSPNH